MAQDIRTVNDMESLITYFSETLGWDIDPDDFYDIDDITYEFDAADLGLKEEAFAKITSLKQMKPLVDDQKWGIFFVEFDSTRFEVSALRKILSGLIPTRRNSTEHAVWDKNDLLFLCTWGENNKVTIGAAHFEDSEKGLPQIKMFSCEPAVEDFTQLQVFEERLSKLHWPGDITDLNSWQELWASAFTTKYRQTIKDSHTLTVQLAEEAVGIRDRILNILDIETSNGYVHLLYDKFRNMLIHDMTEQDFADMYAQTVVYGLFSARCMDSSQDDFSANEAIECIPNTNPFLKSLMSECFGANGAGGKLSFDELEIGRIVELLLHTRTDSIIADFNRQTGGGKEDPVIHFYEDFLNEYDKTQKVQRGVYYTPQPVVNFIVRAVDDVLIEEFGYEDGIASVDTKPIRIRRRSKRKTNGIYKMIEDVEEVPAIQILDPATGTGTFLRQTILQIYEHFMQNNSMLKGEALSNAWSEYVDRHLLTRIHGFELMMAPYAVAHMKLAMILKDTGYLFDSDSRLKVYLTNSLEEPGSSNTQMSFFDDPLAMESISANSAKKNEGINVIIGNPPYNVSSSNRNEWIQNLLMDYKKGLTEKKLNLDDDYIKFIKYAQQSIEKAEEGIVAFITNNSFIDGVSHRRIRESLLETFQQIYVIDLHGNVMKQEKCPDGRRDENVFDIQQGVAITILVRRKGANRFVKHLDLMGSRAEKYQMLSKLHIHDIKWNELTPSEPELLFIPYNAEMRESYDKGFKVTELFNLYNSGIQTKCDEISVNRSVDSLNDVVDRFERLSVEDLKALYPKKKDGRDWSFEYAKDDIMKCDGVTTAYYYRPFDVEYIRYSGKTKGLIAYPRRETMNNMVGHNNIALCMMKQFFQDTTYNHIFVSNLPIDERFLYSNRGGTYIFPLYQYHEINNGIPEYNLNYSIVEKIQNKLGVKISYDVSENAFTGTELIQYIYAILYSKRYREKYNDQLKYDFPSIPYPSNIKYFKEMSKLGEALFNLHLPDMYYRKESEVILEELKSYKFVGADIILNDSIVIEAFEGIGTRQIGGYKPADKWLKDRKGLAFTAYDLEIYKRIVSAIKQTDAIMDEIDNIIEV